jgi:hypothetical protein
MIIAVHNSVLGSMSCDACTRVVASAARIRKVATLSLNCFVPYGVLTLLEPLYALLICNCITFAVCDIATGVWPQW